jgi:hypothetical protein
MYGYLQFGEHMLQACILWYNLIDSIVAKLNGVLWTMIKDCLIYGYRNYKPYFELFK